MSTMGFKSPSLVFLISTFSLFLAAKAHALYSVMDTGELLEEGKFRTNVETQLVTGNGNDGGVNLIGRLDSWLGKETNLRGVVGLGVTDFQMGAFCKWIPYPDVEGQPAVGFKAGVIYAYSKTSKKTARELSVRVHPIVSKKFQVEVGELTPYGSIPFGMAFRKGETKFPVQLAGGVEWKTNFWNQLSFSTELGLNLQKAFSYFSVGAQLYFDME